jgi:hypothetical protein
MKRSSRINEKGDKELFRLSYFGEGLVAALSGTCFPPG